MSLARRHWLLLVAGIALSVAAFAAFSTEAKAHPASTYHWHTISPYPGFWVTCLYSPAGTLVYCPNGPQAAFVAN